MGRRTSSWLSSVKKVFKPNSREHGKQRERIPVEVAEEAPSTQETPEIVSVDQFPAETSPEATANYGGRGSAASRGEDVEDRDHAIAVALATAVAAEAAVAAAQAAAKVVRLAGYGRQSREEKAAILIQSYYRGCLPQWQPERPQWGWNWMERWMATQQWQQHQQLRRPTEPDTSIATATSTDDLSEKMVEMDTGRSPTLRRHPKEEIGVSAHRPPSYMAATQSARAKARTQAGRLQRRPPMMDGGGAMEYRLGRSTGTGDGEIRVKAGRNGGYSPEWSVGSEERTPPAMGGGRKIVYV